MNIIILCLTILICWGIIRIALKAFDKADMHERMNEVEEVEKDYAEVKGFKAAHPGTTKNKQKVVDDFINKE